jgi:hypothetical protein
MTNKDFSDATDEDEPASVHAAPSHFDPSFNSTAQQMTREHNASQQTSRRPACTATGSTASQGVVLSQDGTLAAEGADESKSQDDVERLTQRLDSARRDQQEIAKQFQDEDQESQKILKELAQERDRLKHILKEREEISSDLKKHGTYLDKLNRATQSKKATQERILIQKRAERDRMTEEINCWEKQISEINNDADQMLGEQAEIIASSGIALSDVRERINSEQNVMKSIEEEIRLKGAQIKAIEHDMETADHIDSDERLRARVENEVELAWEENTLAAQAQLANLWQLLQQVLIRKPGKGCHCALLTNLQAQAENQRAQEHLAWWNSKRAKDPSQFEPTPALDFVFPLNPSRSRRIRPPNSRTSTVSSPSRGYGGGQLAFNNVATTSPNFALTSPFFNMSNGMAVSPSAEQTGGQARNDISVDGGPMSPAANDLLPSNLFRDDDVAGQRVSIAARYQEPLGSLDSEVFGEPGVPSMDTTAYVPITPVSASSRPGSIFSSPHESLQNLQSYQPRADSFADSDCQSINSTKGAFCPIAGETNPLPASRIANLFTTTFNRQRGKTSQPEPPSLGTLKQGQSQSFPRNVETLPQDSISSRRRRGSYGNWSNPVAGLLNRSVSASQTPADEKGFISARTGSGRRSRLNMFGIKFDGTEPTPLADKLASSRPSSTFPYEGTLKRPSSESQSFVWLQADDNLNRSSPFGAGWSQTSGPWSRGPSRRASLQHGSTSNLSIGSTPLEPDGYQSSLSKQHPEQLPIGTRPQSAQRPVTPKLNPTAPTFKTIFGLGEAKRAMKSDKQVDKPLVQADGREADMLEMEEVDFSYGESSPANSRVSKDAQSVMTAASLADSHDSLDRSVSGTPSEAVASSGPKETLMQKISRKSSSSKFNVPWAKEKSGLFSRRGGEPPTPDEVNDDTLSETHLRRSVESVSSMPQYEKGSRTALSWPNLRRKSKKSSAITVEHAERISDADGDVEP